MKPALLARLPLALRFVAAVAILLTLWGASGRALAQAPDIIVEIIAPAPLKKLLESNLDIVRWSRRGGLTSGQVEQLYRSSAAQVEELVATEGYFDPRVRSALEKGAHAWKVRLEVQPGEAVLIDSVEVEVIGPIVQDPQGAERIERARRAFGLVPGEQFRQADWDAAKNRVLRSLSSKRYATAELVESRAQIDPRSRRAKLSMAVDSGPTVTFGDVRVQGLRRYTEKLVRNYSPITPGALYDEEALLKFQRRLLATGQFSSALVRANPTRLKPREVPVVVSLVEAQARRVELGAGYSTDRGPRVQAAYRDQNLLDRAWRLSASLAVDALVKEGSIGIAFPRQSSGIHYAVEAKGRDENIRGQDILRWSLTGARVYALEEYESALSLQYLTERSKLDGGSRDVRAALFLNQRWLWNTLDDAVNPRRGATFQLQTGGALEPLLSSRSFGRVHVRTNALYPLGDAFTLALRGEAGAVLAESRQDIPSEYVFRTGGDTSIRGYAYESLGVRENDATVGGRYVLVGSIELIRWLNAQWGVAAFVDGGNAWDQIDKFDAVFGYGLGVRWRSPLGNLSLDLAQGEATGEVRVHFNVGVVLR